MRVDEGFGVERGAVGVIARVAQGLIAPVDGDTAACVRLDYFLGEVAFV